LFSFGLVEASKINEWEETEYIWNFGIAQIADVGLCKDPFLYFINRNEHSKKEILKKRNKSIVWANPDNLRGYLKIFQRLQQSFVLILSDGDNSFPYEYPLTHLELNSLLNNPKITHIFAQNLDFQHPKVSGVPIGLDFHSLAYKKGFNAWGIKESPLEQEKKMKELIKTFEPIAKRKKRVFVDFHLADSMRYGNMKRYLQKGEDRTQIFNKLLSSGLVDYIDKPILRMDLWKKKGEYAFTVSPHGNGLDCHRTWEDLVLGCIVIVKTSSLDPLYEDLPVVIIQDWDEINENNLDAWLKEHQDKQRAKLKNSYWIDHIKTKLG
jgi:hypothetical protein